MANICGKILTQSPLYRGNANKTIFSREHSRSAKRNKTPICLPDKIHGPANKLGDAFIAGVDFKGNIHYKKLLPELYKSMFGNVGLEEFFREIEISCTFSDRRQPQERFYDLRMGIRINPDRMAMEDEENYKMETLFKDTKFDFQLTYPDHWDGTKKQKLAGLLEELKKGRFWFGAGKSKGLGQLQLVDIEKNDLENTHCAPVSHYGNIIRIPLILDCSNSPLLVGWPFHPENHENNQPASWIDKENKKTQTHHDIVAGIADGKIRRVYPEPKDFPKGDYLEFENHHDDIRFRSGRNGENWNQRTFQKTREASNLNDINQIDYLEWFRKKAHEELDKHCDFRRKRVVKSSVAYERVVKSSVAYDRMFSRMLKWRPNQNPNVDIEWELYIPGSTIKGAFFNRAEKIIETLYGDSACVDVLFGKEGEIAKAWFSDAYLVPKDEAKLSSMDSIQIDPATGKPIPGAKMDFLYAAGGFTFACNIILRNMNLRSNDHKKALALLCHLLKDFQSGQIMFGGQKTNGMGWSQGKIEEIEILARRESEIFQNFRITQTTRDGSWDRGKCNWKNLIESQILIRANRELKLDSPLDDFLYFGEEDFGRNLISHGAFSGNCGQLRCILSVKTPLHIKESGSPTLDEADHKQGWDFYHQSSPENHRVETEEELTQQKRVYAIPAKTLKGLTRFTYSLISGGQVKEYPVKDKYGKKVYRKDEDGNKVQLMGHRMHCQAAEDLFGFVKGGAGEKNLGYMGRVSFSFALLKESPSFSWLGLPHDGYEQESKYFEYALIFPHQKIRDEVRNYKNLQMAMKESEKKGSL